MISINIFVNFNGWYILESTTLPWTGSADTSVIIAIEHSEWSPVTIWMSNITFFKYISTINDKYFFLLMLYGTPSYCNVNVYTCISYRFNLLGKSSNPAGPFFKFYPSKLFFETYFLTNIAKFENFKTVKKFHYIFYPHQYHRCPSHLKSLSDHKDNV